MQRDNLIYTTLLFEWKTIDYISERQSETNHIIFIILAACELSNPKGTEDLGSVLVQNKPTINYGQL
jgi:hypothetical protein